MSRNAAAGAALREGDLVAVLRPPGPAWPELIREVWDARAALLPVDHRLTRREIEALLARARPTVVRDADGSARRVGDGIPVEGGIALAVATSGAGGEPKVVELGHDAVRAAVDGSTRALGASPTDPWVCCLPPAHIGGLLVLLRAILLGAPVAVHPRFEPEAVGRDAAGAFLSVVPTMLKRLVDEGVDLRAARGVLVGGAGLPPGPAARADVRVVRTYGLTESCGGVVYDGVPFDATSVRVDEAAGDEILLRGPTVMRRYRGGAAAARLAKDGWLRTGDAGGFGPDGGLHVWGRLDDAIVTGGEKVWPDEVENALREHPGVREVAVAGRPDDEWGQRVVAFVVPLDPASPPTLEDLRAFASERVARFKAPRALVLVDHLPRTRSGKVRRGHLRR